MTQAGEMVWLTLVVFKSAIVHPRGYWGEVKDQMYSALKLCFIPMVISLTAFGIGAPGLQGGNIFSIFGIPERLGSFVVATGIREFAPWIDAMLVAGVVGTAITADIGARRIREEIDAMEVLGVDPIRSLILPRVISTAIITGLFDILASLVGIGAGYIASCLLLGASPAGFIGNFFSEANVPDLVGSFVKTFIFGLIIGIVCCYKGMKASGGAAGVGRAVNSAVVISFAMVWIVNYIFTNTLLGLFPSTQVFR
jgi:phospholipid/cholesterol/gamma-HCH transport system permease protein